MAKVDMHVHSKFSSRPSEWFLQKLGAAESYTDPLEIYSKLDKKGMDFITITDHNKIEGALSLKKLYPDKVIVGLEATTYFPENGCKVHILIYGLNIEQYDMIQKIRNNIYQLREYLQNENLTHAVAHATFAVNKKLTIEVLEKLILLFDIFEGINGGRSKLNNEVWMDVLKNLSPEIISKLEKTHNIRPINEYSWQKGITGGSDDHAGLFLGETYTEAQAENIEQFLKAVRSKRTCPHGRHNNYKSLAFIVYKIALDFAKERSKTVSDNFFNEVSNYLYKDNHTISFKNKIKLKQINKKQNDIDDYVRISVYDLIISLQKEKELTMDERWDLAYDKISNIVDSFFKVLLLSFEKDLKEANLLKIVRNISAVIPGVFITLPFFTAHQVVTNNRKMLRDLSTTYSTNLIKPERKTLWFTDTFKDLNGVSTTLQSVHGISKAWNIPIKIVSAGQPIREDDNYLELPMIHEFELPYYEHQKLKIPSPLIALDKIEQEDPEKIIISTPGPVGILGMFMAKLLKVKCIGIYHTDFAGQAKEISHDESLEKLVDSFSNWFYKQMDLILVPSCEYIDILSEHGIERNRMQLLTRGVDFDIFSPQMHGRNYILDKYSENDGFFLLYTGRISKDKNLDILIESLNDIIADHPDIKLILVGDGPYRNELALKTKYNKNIILSGKIDHLILPLYYSGTDLFVFPSTTDTFGMSVLEAQACGLPALVSPVGGPKEIIAPNISGNIVEVTKQSWKEKILYYYDLKKTRPFKFNQIKHSSRIQVMKKFGWERFFKELMSA